MSVVLFVGVSVLLGQEAALSLWGGSLGGMSTLVSLGTWSAYLFGLGTIAYSCVRRGAVEASPDHLMTAAMLIGFLLLGRVMEGRAKTRTAFAVQHLLACQAATAVLVEGAGEEGPGREREVAVELLHRGDVVKVKHREGQGGYGRYC